MPILYSVISRGTTVLAKYANCAGNFHEVTEQIIANILPQNDKLTYSHGNYFFHYICENGIIYMCITDNEFQRSRAFLFLNEIKRRFQTNYGPSASSAIAYSLNAEFARILANEMKHYSESQDVDTISKVHSELDELKNIMVKNIDNVVTRGEQLEVLVEKTEILNSGMPILYSVVSRGTTVLAKYATCIGNFQEVTEKLIATILPQDDKLTYSHGNYFFHYICENGIIYMCITDKDFEKKRAFLFLCEIKQRFQANYESRASSANAYSVYAEFEFANAMKHYSESHDVDTLSKIHGEMKELKGMMKDNIDAIIVEGINLKALEEKTKKLETGSSSFNVMCETVARSMSYKKIKLYLIMFVVITVIIYFIISMACGGLAWKGCIKK